MNNIFAANEDILCASHKMDRDVDLIKPSKVIGRLGGLVNGQILRHSAVIEATELWECSENDEVLRLVQSMCFMYVIKIT